MARPMPRPDPVMTTILLVKFKVISVEVVIGN
jgi:hypothetical protein